MKFNCAFWHFDGNNAPDIQQMNIYDSNIGCQLWILSGKLKKNNMNLFYFFESGGIDGYTVYIYIYMSYQVSFILWNRQLYGISMKSRF